MADDRKAVEEAPAARAMLMCPCCFAKDIDPIILHYDEVDREYYCIKCVYHGSEADVRAFLADLQRHRYGVQIRR